MCTPSILNSQMYSMNRYNNCCSRINNNRLFLVSEYRQRILLSANFCHEHTNSICSLWLWNSKCNHDHHPIMAWFVCQSINTVQNAIQIRHLLHSFICELIIMFGEHLFHFFVQTLLNGRMPCQLIENKSQCSTWCFETLNEEAQSVTGELLIRSSYNIDVAVK